MDDDLSPGELLPILNKKKTKVIALTTVFGRENEIGSELRFQVDALLTKPVTRTQLRNTLERLAGTLSPDGADSFERPSLQQTGRSVKGHLLVAEDDEINQLVIRELLQGMGYSVTIAANGLEVLKLLTRSDWTAILLDLYMPEMDGWAVSRKIREFNQYDRVPVIALTANMVKQDHERCLAAGMNDVLTKPVDVKRLSGLLDKSRRQKWPYSVEGIDVEQAISRMDGKLPLFQFAMEKFKENYMDFQERMKEEVACGRLSTACRLVHSLKGVAANLCAETLLGAIVELEAVLSGADSNEEWVGKLAAVQSEIERIAASVS